LTGNIFPIGTVKDVVVVDGVIQLAVRIDVAPCGASADGALLSVPERVLNVGLVVVYS